MSWKDWVRTLGIGASKVRSIGVLGVDAFEVRRIGVLGIGASEIGRIGVLGTSVSETRRVGVFEVGAFTKIELVLWRLEPHKSPSWCLETECNHLYIVSILLQRLY